MEVFQASAGDRQDVENFVILFSDGGATLREGDTLPEAVKCKVDGMHISALAVGSDIDMWELGGIVSAPQEMNIYTVSSFSRIDDLIALALRTTCNDVDQCLEEPCRNGGTCVDGMDRYTCVCPSDRTGKHCDRRCQNKYDVAIVVDLSGSVETVYNISMRFVEELVYGMEFRFDTMRAALVHYSSEAAVNFYLNTYRSQHDVLSALVFSNLGGKTNTQAALRLVKDDVFTAAKGDREDVENVVIVLTDGGSNILELNTVPYANEFSQVHVIAVGEQVSMDEVNDMATETFEPYVYAVSNRAEAEAAARRLLDFLCNQ